MPNDNEGLDTLFSNNTANQHNSSDEDNDNYVSLEDEFAALLNEFIQQDSQKPTVSRHSNPIKNSLSQDSKDANSSSGGLDSFMTSDTNKGLDSFATQNNGGGLDSFASSSSSSGLDDFISSSLDGGLDGFVSGSSDGGLDSLVTGGNDSGSGLDSFVTNSTGVLSESGGLDALVSPIEDSSEKSKKQSSDEDGENASGLKSEEQELARAISNFQDAIYAMADKKNLTVPKTEYEESMLIPNYKPSTGRKIAQFMLDCWDIINKYDPENMKRLPRDADDEAYLSFAESLNDTDMQLAIISYVEILINIEICEVGYEQRKEAVQKNRIKKELYEEYMELQERKAMFIKKIKEKKFPIDAEKLISNYFRAAQKDAKGAFDALVKNPAMFAPIDFSKIKPRFFGLIKVTPEDGIKANQKIGEFIKKLKV